MSHYVDGFVVPVPLAKLDAYRKMAEKAGKIWLEHGARQYWECVGDDVKPGKVTSFPQSVQLKDGETVVFSWILYDSREHRDRVNAEVMEDPRMKDMMDPKSMPFDGMRMFWGGFKTILELSAAQLTPDRRSRERHVLREKRDRRNALILGPGTADRRQRLPALYVQRRLFRPCRESPGVGAGIGSWRVCQRARVVRYARLVGLSVPGRGVVGVRAPRKRPLACAHWHGQDVRRVDPSARAGAPRRSR